MKKIIFSLGVMAGVGGLLAGTAQAADPSAGKDKAQACASCHAEDGNSTNPEYPKLAGQGQPYLVKQLEDFKESHRESQIMEGQVADLSEEDFEDIAAYYAEQSVEIGQADEELVELGEKIYRGGNSDDGVAACTACHGAKGQGNPEAGFPALQGQHAEYTASELRKFRDGERDNDAGQMMRNIADGMSDQEIEAVASYVEGLH